jgi:hypothetical protein
VFPSCSFIELLCWTVPRDLGDGDFAALVLASLRDDDAEDAILHLGLDIVVFGELPVASFRDPILL